MPLSSSNLSMIGPTSSSLRPEYTTNESSPGVNPSGDTDAPPEADPPDADPPDADPEDAAPPDSPCPHPTATSAARTISTIIEVLFKIRSKNRESIYFSSVLI